ncbi:MAG: hypothetical protein ACD_75C01416G0001 [uncultured bacterium]|nr:MAG: hypothetical protein ACD_75C01416G0001 [uncultured bacterium]
MGKESFPKMYIFYIRIDPGLGELLLPLQTKMVLVDDLYLDPRDPGAFKYRFDFTHGPDIRRFGR